MLKAAIVPATPSGAPTPAARKSIIDRQIELMVSIDETLLDRTEYTYNQINLLTKVTIPDSGNPVNYTQFLIACHKNGTSQKLLIYSF